LAFNHGRVTTFTIDDSGGTPRDLSAYAESASIDLSGDVEETTTFGATGDSRTYIRGLNGGSFSVSGFYDNTASTGPDAVLESLYDATSTSTFALSFDGDTTTYGGEAWCTSYNVSASVGGVASWSADFTITGQTTRT
jgi:hypothetical protein